MTEDGTVEHTAPGFAAIGIGDLAATTVLTRTYGAWKRATALAAFLLEAKFVAEVSPFIGKDTIVLTTSPTANPEMISTESVDGIREIWDRYNGMFVKEASQRITDEWERVPDSET
jgi:hypothetical protein